MCRDSLGQARRPDFALSACGALSPWRRRRRDRREAEWMGTPTAEVAGPGWEAWNW